MTINSERRESRILKWKVRQGKEERVKYIISKKKPYKTNKKESNELLQIYTG